MDRPVLSFVVPPREVKQYHRPYFGRASFFFLECQMVVGIGDHVYQIDPGIAGKNMMQLKDIGS